MLNFFPLATPPVEETADHIVIGSGVAGLYTALELSERHRVILITKTTLNESNTHYAQGGIAAALGVHDSPELHYQDTLMAGAGLCDSQAVLTLVYDGPKRVEHLIDLGVPFDRDAEHHISFTREAAHSRRRVLHAAGDATGREISNTLIQRVRASKNITVYEDHFAIGLATTPEGRCQGVATIHKGELQLFLSSTVILCSGGLGQIYGSTTNPQIATGDGMILAYNAGASLCDLEFVQFHPTALCLPPAPPFLISEAVRGEGAILLNRAGQRFMADYHPLAELAPRDVVARGIFAEIQKDAHPVYLDLSQIAPGAIKKRFPNIYETCLHYGLDISSNPIPVAPAAHYMMGGVRTDLQGKTTIPGLFAAGEVACTGVHGANRLASNSLLEGLVFSGRVADHLRDLPIQPPCPSEDLVIHYPPLQTDLNTLDRDYRKLHEITDNYLGIVRNHDRLQQALTLLSSKTGNNPAFQLEPAYFELQSMIQLASLMIRAALTRTESRGGHYREDYPAPDPTWRKHIIFHHSKMEVSK